jgi:hypothetical protein
MQPAPQGVGVRLNGSKARIGRKENLGSHTSQAHIAGWPISRWMHYPQPEHFFEAIKIMIPMQQFLFGLQTQSCDQTIDRLADGIAAPTQLPIVLSSSKR